MHTHTIAAGTLGGFLGLTATGLAALSALMLVLGIKGKGKKKLASGPAQLVSFYTEMFSLRADGPMHDFGSAMQQITQALADNATLSLGPNGVMWFMFILALFAPIVPATAGITGLLLAAAAAQTPDGSLGQAFNNVMAIVPNLLGS